MERDSLQLKSAIGLFSNLHVAKVKGCKAPHKAILLLSVIDMVEAGTIASPRIRLTDELERTFHKVWHRYLADSAVFKSDIAKPFFHMQHESFWWLVEKQARCSEECGRAIPSAVAECGAFYKCNREKKELPNGGYSVSALREAFAYAEIDVELFNLLRNADARAMLRVVLINTYLSNQPTKILPDMSTLLAAIPLLALVA